MLVALVSALVRLVNLVIFGIAVCIILGYAFPQTFPFTIFPHFSGQFFIILIPLFACTVITQNRIASGIALACWLWVGWYVIGTDLLIPLPPSPSHPALYYLNAHYKNHDTAPIIADILRRDPRIVGIVELNDGLSHVLKQNGFTMVAGASSESGDGMGWFVRGTDTVAGTGIIRTDTYPIVWLDLMDSRRLYLVHPFPPLTWELTRRQTRFFMLMREILRERGDRSFVLVGDFNATVYSRILRETFAGWQYVPTYSWAVGTPFSLPIDYAVSNDSFREASGPVLTSDHIPLVIDW